VWTSKPGEQSSEQPIGAPIGAVLVVWVGALIASVLLFNVALAVSGHSGEELNDLPFWLYPTVSMVVLWLPTIVGLTWVSRRNLSGSVLRDFGFSFRRSDLLGIPIGIACQIGILRIVYWPLQQWFPETFASDEVERAARELSDRAVGGWRVVLVLAVVVGAPLVEELLYRGLIFGSLRNRLSPLLTVLVGAFWFAAAHMQGVQFVGLLVFGIVLGVCRQRTGRLGMGVLAHAAFNATSLVILWPTN